MGINKNIVIIAAAGNGTRMKHSVNKQYIMLGGLPVIVRTIKRFQEISEITDIYIAVNPDEIKYFNSEIIEKYLTKASKIRKIISGGKLRFDSVFAALKASKGDNRNEKTANVIIHDGVRPFFSKQCITKGLELLKKEVGVITGVKLKDSVVIEDKSFHIDTSLNRDKLVAVQTPQFFKLDVLYTCYKEAIKLGLKPTDDSAVLTASNFRVKIIEGDYMNLKLTTPEDMIFAEVILSMQRDIHNVS